MKKIISLILMILMFTTLVQGVTYNSIPEVELTIINQDPDPVSPGDYVDIRFKINVVSEATAKDFVVELLPTYPFSLDPNEIALRDLGDLTTTGNGDYSIRTKYKVRVDEDAIEGENQIKLRYKLGTSPWITESFDINIQSVDATISIESVKTSPEIISPGENAQVVLIVKNIADSLMKDVTIKLDLTYASYIDQVTTTTLSDSLSKFDSIPFAPLGSATEKKVKTIKSGEEVSFTYDLVAYPEAESKVYKVPIEITYYDELETAYTKYDIIGLVVGSTPDISVVVDDTDLVVGKKKGDVSIRFVNKGLSDIKFLNIKLDETIDYEILSSKEVYLGNVDSDDYEIAEYTLYMNKNVDSKFAGDIDLTLPLLIEYKDANNNAYSKEIDLPLKIYNSNKISDSKKSSPINVVTIIIVLVVLWFVIKRFKKSKKKD